MKTWLPAGLPPPSPAALAHLQRMQWHLADLVRAHDGCLPFEQWMHDALYAPGLGYYAAGQIGFGGEQLAGDFTTAPELTPLFGQTLAAPVAAILEAAGSVDILEFGAGSGALAASLLPALLARGVQARYHILDVSPALQARQRERLQPWLTHVHWLESPPRHFAGAVIANEVLDAMPATCFEWSAAGDVLVRCVTLDQASPSDTPAFGWRTRPADPALAALVASRMPALPGYRSEVNRQAEAWVSSLGGWLQRGAALLIDYGFPQAEYYHPQRAEGTLMCHYQHRSHADPLVLPGLQDITTHVDFSAMAAAAEAGGLDVLGYTGQGAFLLDAGLPDLLMASDELPAPAALGRVQTLLSEAEMGELFKVLVVGRGLDVTLPGLRGRDRRGRL